MAGPVDIVRRLFAAWLAHDRAAAEALVADGFHFTSPLDNRLDRAAYFERCWPAADVMAALDLTRMVVDGDVVAVSYEATATNGKRFRNTEVITVRGDQVVETEVYFGWNLPHDAPAGGFRDKDQDDRDAIRHIIERRIEGLRTKDPATLTADYAPDLLSYELPPPLATRGVDRPTLEAWLAGWDGPIEAEFRDTVIELGGPIAFATGLFRMRAKSKAGKPMDLWTRTTMGLRKNDGRWRIVHEHVSVPFYMDGSDRAALDLTP